MYYVDINSFVHKDNKEPYETVVKICITDILFKRFIKFQLSESPHLINIYYNPLLKCLGMSPVIVTIDSITKESASQTKELCIDQEIRFYFAYKKHRSHFEKKILHSLIAFLDTRFKKYEKKYFVYW